MVMSALTEKSKYFRNLPNHARQTNGSDEWQNKESKANGSYDLTLKDNRAVGTPS